MMHIAGSLAIIFQSYFNHCWSDHICETIPWVSVSYSQVCWAFDQLYLVVSLTKAWWGSKYSIYWRWLTPLIIAGTIWEPFNSRFFTWYLKFDGKCVFYFSSWSSNHYNFCTWHNSYAKFCCEYFTRSRMRAKRISHWFSVKMEQSLVKRSLHRVSVWNKSACLWGFGCDAATGIQNIFQIVMLTFAQHISADQRIPSDKAAGEQ